MGSRRDFLQKAALLAAGGGVTGFLPASIQRAFAIDPPAGSTFLDAEHIVILMQENRSFDHTYGTLRGVRGFNDPRAITLPNGHAVWLQTDKAGETYAPFRLNIKDTNATWMSSLPHDWIDQTDARNGGWHNRWLDAKRSGRKEYAAMPLTLGFHTREDIPFYYALADAFTTCDQNFCSSLTGTTPNRLHLWTGTIRATASVAAKANVRNEDADYETAVSWKTFPERLEDYGISWKIYQNETCLPTGLSTEEDAWLGNFGDNPIEYFTQFRARFTPSFRRALPEREKKLAVTLERLEAENPADPGKIAKARRELEQVRRDLREWTEENFTKLSPREQSLHRRALVTNEADPAYRKLMTVKYRDGESEREMRIPKGDLFHQFRADVQSGQLPTVSWVVAPENFSDHPSSPWYGAWYLSEAFDILTQNPAVWRKTIFILCYDENDGYFDHIPPFVPPDPTRPETGKASRGLSPELEHVRIEQEQERQRKYPKAAGRAGPIGLGYRVPLVIASPWSRGGYVCSQVFDHTSILQLLEKVLSHKTGRKIRETQITAWRRTVCADLSSAFRPYNGEVIPLPTAVQREPFLTSIHQAQFKPVPDGFKKLSVEEIAEAKKDPRASKWLPRQEAGIRSSCALPYDLVVDGAVEGDGRSFAIEFTASDKIFGRDAAGAPFQVYALNSTKDAQQNLPRSYAVSAGDTLRDAWPIADFIEGKYHLCVHGPNGFFREFRGSAQDPSMEIHVATARIPKENAKPVLLVRIKNREPKKSVTVTMEDVSYGQKSRSIALGTGGRKARAAEHRFDLTQSFGWYDLRVQIEGATGFEIRFAGRVETGHESFTDPLIGRT